MLLARPEDFMKTAKNFNIQIRLRVRVSPDHFQRKLDLARCRLCGGNQPGAGDGSSSLIEPSEVSGRRGKISPVQYVETFRAEWKIDAFCKAVDGVVLKIRSI